MIDIKYFIILAAFVLMLVGFYFKSYVITALSAMMLMILGVWVIWYAGIPITDTFLINTIGITMISIGGYVFLRGTWEQYKDY